MGEINTKWAELKPQIGAIINQCNTLESRYEKAVKEAYTEGYKAALEKNENDKLYDYNEGFKNGVKTMYEAALFIFNKPAYVVYDCFPVIKQKGLEVSQVFFHYPPDQILKRIGEYKKMPKRGDVITDGKGNYLIVMVKENSYECLQGTDFEPISIGKDYAKTGHFRLVNDPKDMDKVIQYLQGEES